jgi:glycosyltransferase involved in cell wall biosynthesis
VSGIDVSVVMSVFNGAHTLPATLASILDQQGCRFEFIVVDDGSTDATATMLDEWAKRDERLRIVHQSNTGLTRALKRGCSEAKGEYIARQDCGDVSLPGRLERQWRHLQKHPQAAMVACAVQFVGPAGEPLFVTARPGRELHEGLSLMDVNRVKGPPHHGGTMFPRALYENAGGYRHEFIVAQDIDLWLRLSELGDCIGEQEVAYEARMEAGSISTRRRTDQFRFAALAIECAKRRRQGGQDITLLESAASPALSTPERPVNRLEHARFLYFIGSCLRRSDPDAARQYYWKAFREYPLLVKSLFRLALG